MKKRTAEEWKQTELRSRIVNPSVSPFKRYQSFVLGDDRLSFLIKYEIITSIFGSIPGAAGLALRKYFFPLLFQKIGSNVIFGRDITIRHPKKIVIGSNVVIDDHCVIDAKGENNTGIIIGDNVFISRNTIISCKEGDIRIGNDANIGTNCLIHSETSVTIGNYALIAAYCYIVAGGSHHFDNTEVPIILQPSISKGGVVIQDDVWLGAGVKVLDGSSIDQGVIVGAGAVVNGDLPPYSVAAGIPAKVIKKRRIIENE